MAVHTVMYSLIDCITAAVIGLLRFNFLFQSLQISYKVHLKFAIYNSLLDISGALLLLFFSL